MTTPKRVLLVEDDKHVAAEIKECLEDSTKYSFSVSISPDAISYARDHYRQYYDAYIVDLQLDGRPRADQLLYLGHLIVSVRHSERPEKLIVVYSAHADLEQVVHAMRQGATTFIAKSQTSISGLVEMVERSLDEEVAFAKERERVEALIEHGAFGWRETYAGKVIVVVNDTILASGDNRLEALLGYRNLCLENPKLPLKPVVLDLGKSGVESTFLRESAWSRSGEASSRLC